MIDESIRTTFRELDKLRGRSFTEEEYLTEFKRLLSEKLAKIPITTRIAIAVGVEKGEDVGKVADLVAAWDRENEEFKHVKLPHFTKLIDPYLPQPSTEKSDFNVTALLIFAAQMVPIAFRVYDFINNMRKK